MRYLNKFNESYDMIDILEFVYLKDGLSEREVNYLINNGVKLSSLYPIKKDDGYYYLRVYDKVYKFDGIKDLSDNYNYITILTRSYNFDFGDNDNDLIPLANSVKSMNVDLSFDDYRLFHIIGLYSYCVMEILELLKIVCQYPNKIPEKATKTIIMYMGDPISNMIKEAFKEFILSPNVEKGGDSVLVAIDHQQAYAIEILSKVPNIVDDSFIKELEKDDYRKSLYVTKKFLKEHR